MCGLVGVVGKIGVKEEDVFKDMLIVDVLRGPHSTGIVSVSPKGVPDWAKAAMLPQDFMGTRQFKQAFAGNHVLLMGHNRYATKGAISTANAHPFETTHLTGMHNGTLINWYAALEDAQQFDVDSEALLHTMDIRGVKGTYEGLNGAFAVTWHDTRDNTFNIIRNDQRTLYTRMSKDKQTMFYASEGWMISACAGRRGVELDNILHNVPVGKHLSWELPDKAFSALGKGKSVKVPLYVPPPAPVYDGGYQSWRGGQGQLPPANPAANTGGNTGGSTGNVSHLPIRSRVVDEYAKLSGKAIEFYVTELEPENKHIVGATVLGMTVEAPHHPVKIRTSKADADNLMKWMGEMRGVVSSYMAPYKSAQGDDEPGYLTIRSDSVTYIKKEDEEEEDIVVLGPNDKVIDKIEFDKLTTGGCSMCTCNLIYGLDQVEWEGDSPLCEECFDEYTNPENTIPGNVALGGK